MTFTQIPEQYTALGSGAIYVVESPDAADIDLRLVASDGTTCLGMRRYVGVREARCDAAPLLRRALRFEPADDETGFTPAAGRTVTATAEAAPAGSFPDRAEATAPARIFLALFHQDATRCRLARDSAHILLHYDWSAFRPEEARSLPLYPAFEEQADGTLRTAIHYKDYEPAFEHYGVPPYIAGLNVSAIAYKTDRWNISRLDNSFQLSGVMMLDSSADSEAEAERIVRLAEQKFAGNPGQVMFVLRDGGEEDNSRFIPITAQNEGDWQALHEQATSDIVVAHSWFRTLSGLDYGSGFNAERILHEYEVALNTVILARDRKPSADPVEAHLHEGLGGPQGRRARLRPRRPEATGLPVGNHQIQHQKHRMNTLITPAQALRRAFTPDEPLPPATIDEAAVAAAEHRYIVPVIGKALHEKLLSGAHAEFRDGYLAAPIALFVRLLVQPRLDIRTGQCGTTAPKGSSGQPAADTPLRVRQRALRTEARTLLRRASEYLSDHRDEFPEYDPARDILKRCSTDGCLVQIR